eukprot:448262_1
MAQQTKINSHNKRNQTSGSTKQSANEFENNNNNNNAFGSRSTKSTLSKIEATLDALDKQFPDINYKQNAYHKEIKNKRLKSNDHKMDKRTMEHILFAGDHQNDPRHKQKQRMRKRLQQNKSSSNKQSQKNEYVSKKNDKNMKYEQRIMQLQREIKNKKLKMNQYLTEKQICKKTLNETTQTLSKLKRDNEILRNNRDDIQKINLKQQNEINELKKQIETIHYKLDETTQANLRQRETILDLQEQKVDNETCLSKVLKDLNTEIEDFTQNYNEKKLQQMFDNSPTELRRNESKFNQTMNEYNNNTENIILLSKSFIKYINNMQLFVNKISIPNVKEYKTWNLEQIMGWIVSLDDGEYEQYKEQLYEGFIKSRILNGDLLPELTRGDLSNPPFNMNEFVVKRNLERHFKSLVHSNMIRCLNNDNEGVQTKYIEQ